MHLMLWILLMAKIPFSFRQNYIPRGQSFPYRGWVFYFHDYLRCSFQHNSLNWHCTLIDVGVVHLDLIWILFLELLVITYTSIWRALESWVKKLWELLLDKRTFFPARYLRKYFLKPLYIFIFYNNKINKLYFCLVQYNIFLIYTLSLTLSFSLL